MALTSTLSALERCSPPDLIPIGVGPAPCWRPTIPLPAPRLTRRRLSSAQRLVQALPAYKSPLEISFAQSANRLNALHLAIDEATEFILQRQPPRLPLRPSDRATYAESQAPMRRRNAFEVAPLTRSIALKQRLPGPHRTVSHFSLTSSLSRTTRLRAQVLHSIFAAVAARVLAQYLPACW